MRRVYRPSRGDIVEWEVEELLFDKSRPEGHVCERVREKLPEGVS
jgi:hypothetical protein